LADVRRKVQDGERAVAELAEHDRSAVRRRCGELLGYEPSLFEVFAKGAGLELELGEAEDPKTRKAVEAPFARGEGDKREPLADVLKARFGDRLSALKTDPNSQPAAGNPPIRRPGYRPIPAPPEGSGLDPDRALLMGRLRAGACSY
jgi:hypothetical protein